MPDSSDILWDAIVVGGGPAGSSAATFLARDGRRVLVLEKSKFPRFHIGESLLPYNREVFEDLGVWEKISSAGFVTKRGAQFIMGNDSRRNRLDFSCGSFTEHPESLQVERAKFDQILLDHARETGADVREESTVTGYRVEADRVVIDYRATDGTEHQAAGKYFIDASGLTNFSGNRESLREYYPTHKKIAIFAHFEGVDMPTGEEEGDVLIVRGKTSWIWLIPLSPTRTSVGLVIDAAEFKALGKKPEEAFHDAVHDTPAVAKRFPAARMQDKLHVIADFSYQNKRLASPRVLRIGDAAGFIDPMFSSGVLLAMVGARDGAKAIEDALRSGKPLTASMKRYEKLTRKRVAVFWAFIGNFYELRFTQLFFQPYNRWRLVCAINAVLAGRTSLPFAVRWRLRVFFLLVWLNRRIPLAPRIEVS